MTASSWGDVVTRLLDPVTAVRRAAVLLVFVGVALGLLAGSAGPAEAAFQPHDTLVPEGAATGFPKILKTPARPVNAGGNREVFAADQVGRFLVSGGDFLNVELTDGTVVGQPYFAAWNIDNKQPVCFGELSFSNDVLAVEPDPPLVAQSRATYPDLSVVEADAVMLTPERLAAGGHPTSYDLVVCVGNVMILLAEGTERQVLTRLATLLAPGGRILVGFHVAGGGPDFARHYSPAEFTADVEASGLHVDLHAGSYELHPPTDEYAVWVLSAPGRPAQRDQG